MRRIAINLAVLGAVALHNAAGADLWFRPVEGYQWDNPVNWLTGANSVVHRVPQGDDAVLLSSSWIQAESPLVVTGGVTALCQRLMIGEQYNAGSHPVIRVEAGGTLRCDGITQIDTVCIGDHGSGTLLLRGGTLTFGNIAASHRNLQIRKNASAAGVLRGWGTVNPAPSVTNVRMENNGLVIDKNLPGGNILVDSMEGDTVYLQNEMRDTAGWWFYWAFRAKGASGRTLTFRFTNGDPICTRGPVISYDRGTNWSYAASGTWTANRFTHTFPTNACSNEVWFAMGMVYTQRDWEAFLAKHVARGALIETGTLCRSRHGRAVEKARFGCINKPPAYRIWLSARHHAAEMMASTVLEGILDAALADNDLGAWMRDKVEFMVVPFVDKDGVEEGDQGKNRRPHDHNRDYDAFLYPETAAITNWITTSAQSHLDIMLDIHCPWVRGTYNEWLYQVYTKNLANAAAQRRLGELLEACQRGAMDYKVANDLPFGQSWNTDGNYSAGRSFKMWVLDCVSGNRLSTTYEVPFATANRATVTREACREFGEDTTAAFKLFLLETDKAPLQ